MSLYIRVMSIYEYMMYINISECWSWWWIVDVLVCLQVSSLSAVHRCEFAVSAGQSELCSAGEDEPRHRSRPSFCGVAINDSLFVLCAVSLAVCLYKIAKMSLASLYLESKVRNPVSIYTKNCNDENMINNSIIKI